MESTNAALRILKLEDELRATRDKKTTRFPFLRPLFAAKGEVHVKSQLYDAGLQTTGVEGAFNVVILVRKYADRVEQALEQFRALTDKMLAHQPESEEHRSEKEIPSSDLLAEFPAPQDIPVSRGVGDVPGAGLESPGRKLHCCTAVCALKMLQDSMLGSFVVAFHYWAFKLPIFTCFFRMFISLC